MRRNSSNGLDFRESRRVRGSGVRQVAEREGFEPYSPLLAKFLNNADLVDC
jgi:hypothetical protein